MTMPIAETLEYATPRQPRAPLELRPWVARSLLGVSLLLLAVEVFVLALPSLPHAIYGGRLVGVGEAARLLLTNMTWIAFTVAGCSIAAGWRFPPAALTLRLARSIALGVGIFHVFLAPGENVYARLLWGSC